MSRFEHLEFGEGKRAQGPSADGPFGTPTRDAEWFHAQAEKARLDGDFEEALRRYSRALEQNAAFFEGWLGQVRMLTELGEYDEALLWANKALEMFPDHPSLIAARGVAAARNGQHDLAMAYTDNALQQRGAGPFVWLARAEALLLRRSPMAEHCLSNAMGVAAGDPAVQLEAGRLLLRMKRYAAAIPHLRIAVTEMPKSALAWLCLGRCQAALGFPEAAETLRQCLALRPMWKEAESALAEARGGIFGRLTGLFRRMRK